MAKAELPQTPEELWFGPPTGCPWRRTGHRVRVHPNPRHPCLTAPGLVGALTGWRTNRYTGRRRTPGAVLRPHVKALVRLDDGSVVVEYLRCLVSVAPRISTRRAARPLQGPQLPLVRRYGYRVVRHAAELGADYVEISSGVPGDLPWFVPAECLRPMLEKVLVMPPGVPTDRAWPAPTS